jgi:uncharacterized membrane protein
MNVNTKLITFSILIFIVGCVLTYLNYSQYTKLSNKCVSDQVQVGLNIIIMLSIMMIFVPIVQFLCYWSCGCPDVGFSYKWVFIILSLLLISAASVVLNALKDECENSELKYYMIGLIVASIILIFVIVVLPITANALQNNKEGSSVLPVKNKKPEQDSSLNDSSSLDDDSVEMN